MSAKSSKAKIVGRVRMPAPTVAAGIGMVLQALSLASCAPAPEADPPPPTGIEVGYSAPQLAGSLASGEPFALQSGASSFTVLVFYRSAECGLCRVQLDQMQRHLAAYRRQGARLVAVTLDPPDLTRALLADANLEYEIASVDAAVFERWGVMHPELGVAMPATYIIDSKGVIRYRHIGRNAADRALDAGILTVLETMKES